MPVMVVDSGCERAGQGSQPLCCSRNETHRRIDTAADNEVIPDSMCYRVNIRVYEH